MVYALLVVSRITTMFATLFAAFEEGLRWTSSVRQVVPPENSSGGDCNSSSGDGSSSGSNHYPNYDDDVFQVVSVPGADKLQKLLSVRP